MTVFSVASLLLTGAVASAAVGAGPDRAPIVARPPDVATALPGREADAQVAGIAFRLSEAGRARCPLLEPVTGLVFQHLSQFDIAARPAILAALPLDRGPGVIAVVPDGPGAVAGIRPGDVLLAVDGVAIPPEPGLAVPFDAKRARARADAIGAVLAQGGTMPRALALLRDGAVVTVRLVPRPACPSWVHLARSDQLNAFADGHHVFLTTGLLARLHGDDEVAFVVAHEMAHNILGHAAMLRGGEVHRGITRMLGHSGAIVRQTEREADTVAGELMLDGGFDPVAGAEALRRLDGDDAGIDLFAEHGSAAERVAAMRALAASRGVQ